MGFFFDGSFHKILNSRKNANQRFATRQGKSRGGESYFCIQKRVCFFARAYTLIKISAAGFWKRCASAAFLAMIIIKEGLFIVIWMKYLKSRVRGDKKN